jgi:hypothetical protein
LQFGQFVEGSRLVPVRFCPEYLPAYPDFLAHLAGLTLLHVSPAEVDHLLVAANSLPLGVACSLSSHLSLAYSRGRGEPPVYDLVGSYNSGHQAALLVNVLDDVDQLEAFIRKARGVGLETRVIVTLLNLNSANQIAGIPVKSVFQLADIVQKLVSVNRLPQRHAHLVLEWLENRHQANRHQGSESP